VNLLLSDVIQAAQAVGDPGDRGDLRLAGVSTDSRTVRESELFVCLTGERFDGHEFAADAARKGAAAVLAERPLEGVGEVPVLMVPDTLRALGAIAGYWRNRTAARVVAVSGSAGKTTAKEMLAAILAREGKTARNHKNLNNRIGVPLSMLSFTGEEDFWVLELGISLQGEMDELGAMTRPDMAVLINVGAVHTEGLGDLYGVARAKCDLLKYLKPGGRALVSKDHHPLWETCLSLVEPVGFSTRGNPAPYSGTYLGTGEDGSGRYRLDLAGEVLDASCGVRGAYNAENALAAAAAARLLGARAEAIRAGLAEFSPPEQRFRTRRVEDFLLIDDTYNANPLSMRESLRSALEMAGARPVVLVLGDMLELGPEAEREHAALGREIAATSCVHVYYQGEFAEEIARGLGNGHWQGKFRKVDSPEEFVTVFKQEGPENAVILFKGSRGARMERHLEALAGELAKERK
jgi:UDP-N-acetylmuramoyl-tripeptide--D-alanyl-D-alanine ligase